jgi:putative nucleotidyltransferase with HDIG domain
MAGERRFIPFRYKLWVMLFVIVCLTASILGFFQYLNLRMNLENNFEQNRRLIHDRVLNMLSTADYVNILYEKPIETDAREILDKVKTDYEVTKKLDLDLSSYVMDKSNFKLYVIDSNNVVVATTDETDLGLDFSTWTDFAAHLDEIRAGGTFSTSRVSLSINEGNLTKYCYLPSSDGKYIFETGTVIENKDYLVNVELDNFENKIIEENSFVDSIILYDYQGVAYKKDKDGNNIQISDTNRTYFEQALHSMESIKNTGVYNNKEAYYDYIPYEIMGASGANERNVVEIIYNDQEVKTSLHKNLGIIIVGVLAAAVISAWIGSYMARRITKPVEEITEGVKRVADGNLTYEFNYQNNDEFYILGNQFNTMLAEIRKLLEERYQFEKNLQNKNKEIYEQKEEITALYEETTALNEELEKILKQNLSSYFETVRALANAIDEKDSYTGGHCERVMAYSTIIATELGLSQQELDDLRFGSILHDIGKIGISEYILNKDGKLTPEEYDEIKKHPEKGNYILKDLNFLHNCRRIINEHHERIDGKGYPKGLSGDDIYYLAKIVCVADAFDAMTSSRPYRKNALSKEEAMKELLKNKGVQFDETVVDAFIRYLKSEGNKGSF